MGQANAAVDGAVADAVALGLADDDGTGPAVTLAAAFLGAAEPQVLAQQLQQGAAGWYIAECYHFTSPDELDGLDGVARRFWG